MGQKDLFANYLRLMGQCAKKKKKKKPLKKQLHKKCRCECTMNAVDMPLKSANQSLNLNIGLNMYSKIMLSQVSGFQVVRVLQHEVSFSISFFENQFDI